MLHSRCRSFHSPVRWSHSWWPGWCMTFACHRRLLLWQGTTRPQTQVSTAPWHCHWCRRSPQKLMELVSALQVTQCFEVMRKQLGQNRRYKVVDWHFIYILYQTIYRLEYLLAVLKLYIIHEPFTVEFLVKMYLFHLKSKPLNMCCISFNILQKNSFFLGLCFRDSSDNK